MEIHVPFISVCAGFWIKMRSWTMQRLWIPRNRIESDWIRGAEGHLNAHERLWSNHFDLILFHRVSLSNRHLNRASTVVSGSMWRTAPPNPPLRPRLCSFPECCVHCCRYRWWHTARMLTFSVLNGQSVGIRGSPPLYCRGQCVWLMRLWFRPGQHGLMGRMPLPLWSY